MAASFRGIGLATVHGWLVQWGDATLSVQRKDGTVVCTAKRTCYVRVNHALLTLGAFEKQERKVYDCDEPAKLLACSGLKVEDDELDIQCVRGYGTRGCSLLDRYDGPCEVTPLSIAPPPEPETSACSCACTCVVCKEGMEPSKLWQCPSCGKRELCPTCLREWVKATHCRGMNDRLPGCPSCRALLPPDMAGRKQCATPGCTFPDFHDGACSQPGFVGERPQLSNYGVSQYALRQLPASEQAAARVLASIRWTHGAPSLCVTAVRDD